MHARGFTLLEVLVVMAIFVSLTGLGLIYSIGSFQGNIFRSEQSTIVSVVSKARSRALANYEQSPWGVCYLAPNYVVFKGSVCTPGESVEANANIASASQFTSEFPTIVFTQLSGTSSGGVIRLRDGVSLTNQSTTTINYEGTIIW